MPPRATILSMIASASTLVASPMPPVPLWPEGAPGALGKTDKDIPTLTAYLPEPGIATGAAMVICPGGGYGKLAPHEGAAYAEWLARHGVAGLVLRYRLGTDGYRHPCMLQDAARAMRLARKMAGEWKIDPARIGIMGSSAGGHLAATLLTHFDAGKADAADPIERFSSRPDLGVLCYPVITMSEPFGHAGSKENLLGKNPDPALAEDLSCEKRVRPDTPPTFIWHTSEDAAVPAENSLVFASALGKAKVPYELHVYEKGHHGLGLGNPPLPWTTECLRWLRERGFVR